jgi:hypothetical protein
VSSEPPNLSPRAWIVSVIVSQPEVLFASWRVDNVELLHIEDLPNGHNLALNRTLSLSRTCGSVQAGDHCCPRGVILLPPPAAM